MGLIMCPDCRKRVSDSLKHCHNCGSKLEDAKLTRGLSERQSRTIINTGKFADRQMEQGKNMMGFGCAIFVIPFALLMLYLLLSILFS